MTSIFFSRSGVAAEWWIYPQLVRRAKKGQTCPPGRPRQMSWRGYYRKADEQRLMGVYHHIKLGQVGGMLFKFGKWNHQPCGFSGPAFCYKLLVAQLVLSYPGMTCSPFQHGWNAAFSTRPIWWYQKCGRFNATSKIAYFSVSKTGGFTMVHYHYQNMGSTKGNIEVMLPRFVPVHLKTDPNVLIGRQRRASWWFFMS